MLYYTWFHRRGHATLVKKFGPADPFDMTPVEIVDSIVRAGCSPAIERPRHVLFRSVGRVSEVERDGHSFLVSISRDAEEISVQERREEPYHFDPFQ